MSAREVQQARWNEPIIMNLGSPGERGVIVPPVGDEIENLVGDGVSTLPAEMRREKPPTLPELSQHQVLRHFLRLSQETYGADVNTDFLGTCTMKPTPKVNEQLIRAPEMADLHPLQDEDTVQGILEIMFRFELMLREISGMSRFTFQPGGGAHGIYANALMMRAYHSSRGEGSERDEVITTIFSHPADAACPATAGYKIVTLYAGEHGYPDLDALKAAVSERTAGLMITNPEDTGIFNPEIDRFTDVVHEAGGLCAYDQANANGILGIARARDAGFDLCQFNLHKTFSSAHCAMGMSCAACGVSEELERFLPVPIVQQDGGRFFLDYDRPDSIGKLRGFYGVPATVVRAYAWVMALGAEGIQRVAEGAVLNNNYLAKLLEAVDGLEVAYARGNLGRRLEQTRYTWEKLAEETGVGTLDISRRTADFGVTAYVTSHHPWIVPEPMTLEPTECYSKSDLEDYATMLVEIAREAREAPDVVRTAPHRSAMHRLDDRPLDDPAQWATTWRSYLRKTNGDRSNGSSG